MASAKRLRSAERRTGHDRETPSLQVKPPVRSLRRAGWPATRGVDSGPLSLTTTSPAGQVGHAFPRKERSPSSNCPGCARNTAQGRAKLESVSGLEQESARDSMGIVARQPQRAGRRRTQPSDITRERAVAILGGRFDRRLTLVVGGPGFGKSTVLSQAIAANELEPLGTDLLLSIVPADNDADVLGRALRQLLELPEGDGSTADVLRQLQYCPPGTCILLDDVHELDENSSGFGLLTEMVRSLPLPVSLVIASRELPRLPLSALRSKGEVTEIGPSELLFDHTEMLALRSRLSADERSNEFGGWPALTMLATNFGPEQAERFLLDEVVSTLSAQDLRRLGVVFWLNGADGDTLHAAFEAAQPTEALALV